MRYIKMSIYFLLLFSWIFFGCSSTFMPVKMMQQDYETIEKCAHVNILRMSRLSYGPLFTNYGEGLFGAVIRGVRDRRDRQISNMLHDFDMDKVFSSKIHEVFSKEGNLPLVPVEEVDGLPQTQDIKKARQKDNDYSYLLEKGIDCVLQTYITWYGIRDPDGELPRVCIDLNVRLIRIRDSKIMWREVKNTFYAGLKNEDYKTFWTYKYEKFIANDSKILREELVKSVDTAAQGLLDDFLNMK